ncbi:MAG: type II toxin-antitoxin system RelE/ParE family toxin [Clostridiales bacterium]|jgi:hypothetical protein|nr:type II toxin-antitoxin system RelE/ParE family toxin [Clostridiales bacterium]MDR2712646.1 type II toxin-antitoxin system RelE/ParE family toxin [Clostridiales bacterium]
MKREFIATTVFDKRWKGLDLSDEDLSRLENYIMDNPAAGNMIEGTGGAIKLRYALPGQGKSGSVRVIFIDIIKAEKVYFLTCYPKSRQNNLSDNEKAAIKEVVKRVLEREREVLQ